MPKKFQHIRIFLVLFTVQLALISNINSQQNNLKFKEISLNQGLSQTTVFCSLQDSRGFLWFGTRTGGLNKYDGYTFTHYKNDRDNENSISGNEIISILEDNSGDLWIGTRNNGLNKLDIKTEKFKRYLDDANNDKTENTTINAIHQDKLGHI